MMTQQAMIMVMITVGLLLPTPALAVEAEQLNTNNVECPQKNDGLTPCDTKVLIEEINLLPNPSEIKVGEITYVSGGVFSDEVQHMKNIANNYPLEIVLVEKTEEYEKESYIADVHVKIIDTTEKVVLDVITEGPFLLVNLPDGQYQVSAEYNAINQTKLAKVSQKKHRRVVFLWANSLP